MVGVLLGVIIGITISLAVDTTYLLDKYYFERKYGIHNPLNRRA